MEIIFIGTSSGKTSLMRDHSSIAFKSKPGEIFLIDAGDGISKSLLKHGLDYNKISAILLTHYHPDHFSGISSLLTQMKLTNRENPLVVYTHKNLVGPLQSFLNSCYLFKEVFDFELTVSPFEFDQAVHINNEMKFEAIRNSHVYNKYKVTYPESLFISSSIYIETVGTKILYTSDIGSEQDLDKFDHLKPDILISETTHIRLEAISEFAVNQKIGRVYLTHIDDDAEKRISGWIKTMNQTVSTEFILAEDGLKFSLFSQTN